MRILSETWELIKAKLRLGLSPEHVSGWLSRQHAIQVNHEWIYRNILTDKQAGAICIVICAAKRNGANVTAAMTGAASCQTG